MSIVAGGSNGITFPNGSNTPAGSVTGQFSPNITDTSNTMVITNKGTPVAFCGTNGVVIGGTTTTCGGYVVTISTNVSSAYCVRAKAVSAGWCQSAKLLLTINNGIIVSSSTTATPAMTVAGSFPNGVTIINKGYIIGMGGPGGTGVAFTCGCSPSAPASGGTAFKASAAVTICNSAGVIGGGGGGGGAGGYGRESLGCCGTTMGGGGGGGGRSGNTNSSGGGGGAGGGTFNPCYPCLGQGGRAGTAGTFTSGGSGGAGGNCDVLNPGGHNWQAGNGASGGTWGATGTATSSYATPRPPGAGGKATCGASTYITWKTTGTRYGSIS